MPLPLRQFVPYVFHIFTIKIEAWPHKNLSFLKLAFFDEKFVIVISLLLTVNTSENSVTKYMKSAKMKSWP